MNNGASKNVALIVAHPDDEILWAGGTILNHLSWNFFIVCMCRKHDRERADRFYQVLKIIKANGIMGDLDDEKEQKPLEIEKVKDYILDLLPARHFDLIITHNPSGEYTKHLRHEEISQAVIELWADKKILGDTLWTFAYKDGNKEYYPRAIEKTPVYQRLSEQIWLKKYSLITQTYGFKRDSWEAKTTPQSESFWQFTDTKEALMWLSNKGIQK